MKKLLLATLALAMGSFLAKAQLFSQNFNSSNVVTDYVSATPNNGQFTSISNASNNPSSINNGALRFTKTGGSTGYLVRNANFNSSALKISFSLTVSSQISSGTNQATFYVGSGLQNGATEPSNTVVNSKFGINFETTLGSFSLRDISGATSSAQFTGTQIITFIVNKSTTALNYLSPLGNNATLATNKWDLWVGNTLVFDERSATTATVNLENFRFSFPTGSQNATIDIDDILINDQPTTLPVKLLQLSAEADGENINLAWNTATEINNSHFDILRSASNKTFLKIGEVKGPGTTLNQQDYVFRDKAPLLGKNYYQLKQIDDDGKATFSEIVSVKSNVSASNIKAFTNGEQTNILIGTAHNSHATLSIYEITGKKIIEKSLLLTEGYQTIPLPLLQTGIYLATLVNGNEILSKKFIK